MLSDVLSDLHATVVEQIAEARAYQERYPDIYDEKKPEIDAALAALEAALPALESLRVFYDTPPKE